MPDSLEQVWYLMDLVQDVFQCDNKNLNSANIGKFYSHPVWLLNGLFIEQDNISMGYRHAISDWIIQNGFKDVIDYGGGFGTLARLIAEKDSTISMSIYEPHPSKFGLRRANEYRNISMIDKLNSNYDCLVSTDVLEHVVSPLENFLDMIESVKMNGYLVIANSFFPVIKCHLPQNFHFRYSFNTFARIMGLEVVGILKGSHATIFKKINDKELDWNKIRFYEKLSKIVFPLIEIAKPILRPIKRFMFK